MSNKGFGGAGILDYHVMTAIQQGWTTLYANNETNFKGLFAGISDPVLHAWFVALTEKDLAVRLTGSRGATTFPSVVVQLESEQMIEWPVGLAAPVRLGTGNKREAGYPMIVQQNVLVEARAPGPESARALAVVVRGIMAVAHAHFLSSANYIEVQYTGMAAMSPDEEYIAERAGFAGIGVVRLQFQGKSQVWIPDPLEEATPVHWFVQASDITGDGDLQGGVVAVT